MNASVNLRKDIFKLLLLVAALAAIAAVFLLTPSLSTPTFLSIVSSLLLSPLVAALERRGCSRGQAIAVIFSLMGLLVVTGGLVAAKSLPAEWGSFKDSAPKYFDASMARMRQMEAELKLKYPVLAPVDATGSAMRWGERTGQWFLKYGPAAFGNFLGQLLTCLFVVPLLTFGLLKEGPELRKRIFRFVPNRFFESSFMVSWRILTSLSDYIRAKLIEALLVGIITTLGLWMVGAPYAIVLGAISGITNILPYLGPILGIVPALLIVLFDSAHASLLWPVMAVYGLANLIDTVVIFPVIVAQLVNLNPVVLIVVVMLGGEYYGLVGMLISIPIATGIKIVLQEILGAVAPAASSRT